MCGSKEWKGSFTLLLAVLKIPGVYYITSILSALCTKLVWKKNADSRA